MRSPPWRRTSGLSGLEKSITVDGRLPPDLPVTTPSISGMRLRSSALVRQGASPLGLALVTRSAPTLFRSESI